MLCCAVLCSLDAGADSIGDVDAIAIADAGTGTNANTNANTGSWRI